MLELSFESCRQFLCIFCVIRWIFITWYCFRMDKEPPLASHHHKLLAITDYSRNSLKLFWLNEFRAATVTGRHKFRDKTSWIIFDTANKHSKRLSKFICWTLWTETPVSFDCNLTFLWFHKLLSEEPSLVYSFVCLLSDASTVISTSTKYNRKRFAWTFVASNMNNNNEKKVIINHNTKRNYVLFFCFRCLPHQSLSYYLNP